MPDFFSLNRILATKLIHIVDHEIRSCENLSLLFRLEGYRTVYSLDTATFDATSENNPPDVVIINLDMGEDSALDLLKQIKSRKLGIPVIMLTDGADVDTVVSAMKFGATDVLAKPVEQERLLSVVREVFRRDIFVKAEHNGVREVEVAGFPRLTSREREVLQLITDGCSNKGAAKELGISARTIEVHRANIMQKLGAKNAAELIRIVLTR